MPAGQTVGTTDARRGVDAPALSNELNTGPEEPSPQRGQRTRSLAVKLGRLAMFAVLVPPRKGLRHWSRLRPAQQLVLGFLSYVLIGAVLLSLPIAQTGSARFIDHLFIAASAVSTTGLATVSVADTYTFFGEAVVLALFQLGGIGYMTLSSLLILARGKALSPARLGVLKAGFSVPHYFVLPRFLVHVITFTLVVEVIGALILWWRFSALGVEDALWSGVFHSVSAFATAGFGLHNNSLENYAQDWVVQLTIGVLCYLGAIGFIVVQDVWYSIKFRERMLTLTSKVILSLTAAVFVLGTIAMFFSEPTLRGLPWAERLMHSAFQVMSASTTAGFNTIPIGGLGTATLLLITLVMLIGASPSGTGGGIKTTSVSALLANMLSVLRGRDSVAWLGHEVPLVRVLQAFAAVTMYLLLLGGGLFALTLTQEKALIALLFEAASALGTVGLSTGITGEMTTTGKLILIALMFAGRCGPLTLGLALLRPDKPIRPTEESLRRDDLAT